MSWIAAVLAFQHSFDNECGLLYNIKTIWIKPVQSNEKCALPSSGFKTEKTKYTRMVFHFNSFAFSITRKTKILPRDYAFLEFVRRITTLFVRTRLLLSMFVDKVKFNWTKPITSIPKATIVSLLTRALLTYTYVILYNRERTVQWKRFVRGLDIRQLVSIQIRIRIVFNKFPFFQTV